MAFWYDGNKNYTENKREKDGIVYYIRGVVTVDGKQFERYAINTHFVTRGEDIVELMEKYVLPLSLTPSYSVYSAFLPPAAQIALYISLEREGRTTLSMPPWKI